MKKVPLSFEGKIDIREFIRAQENQKIKDS